MGIDRINDLKLHTAPLQSQLLVALQRVLESGWFVLGTELSAFEQEFASYCGVNHAVGVANGTDALELALRALEIGAGDEVLTAANAGMYATSAILAIGAIPVFVDVEAKHLTIDPDALIPLIGPKTRAIIATHLYGRMADMLALQKIADQHHLVLIEDCAQAHGAICDGMRAGAWGNAAAFSFYPTKNLGALGDGGLVTCKDEAVAQRLRSLRQYGWDSKYSAKFAHGRNSRLDEVQAAMLRVKLPFLDTWNKRRREIACLYVNHAQHPLIQHPEVQGEDYVAHLYVLRSNYRDTLADYLRVHNISTDIHFPLLDYQQHTLRHRFSDVHLPVSEKTAAEILTLPCYPELNDISVHQICDVIRAWNGQ